MNLAELSDRIETLAQKVYELKQIVDALPNAPPNLTDAVSRVNELVKAIVSVLPEI